MNHIQNLVRLFIVVCWIVVVFISMQVFANIYNVLSLGFPSLLFYGVVYIVVLYAGFHLSKNFWSIKK